MLVRLLGRWALVAGLRGARVGEPAELIKALRDREELKDVVFQLADARMVAGPEHLLVAALGALRAFETEMNVASDLGLEVLTFASGQRQISRAIELMGLKPGSGDVAVLILGSSPQELEAAFSAIAEELGGERDDSVLEVDEEKAGELAEAFRISRAELNACRRLGELPEVVKALVLERVALSVAYR